MNIIDKKFNLLVSEIKSKNEKELYYHIRSKYDNIEENIKKSMEEFFNNFLYWGKLDSKNGIYEEIEEKVICIYNHIEDIKWVYDNLSDYRSKYTLYSIINNWYNYDFELCKRTVENMYDEYFDLDIVKCNNNEVIVDIGAYIGDTILSYMRNYGEECYKKIYCYEISPDNYNILINNLKKYKNIIFKCKGISNEEGKMGIKVNKISSSANYLEENEEGNVVVTTLDKDINEKISLIKMDIEGYESKALEGSKNHIMNDHPKLLISVYHCNNDIWKIPKMIYEMDNSYKFYLRYKSSPIYPTEITLICI